MIYKGNLPLLHQFYSKTEDFMIFQKAAPKTVKILLAQQGLIKVQLHRPDFDNGMKTADLIARKVPTFRLHRPDFDNGMKTIHQTHYPKACILLHRPDFDNGMKTKTGMRS